MKKGRRRVRQITSLEERLTEEAKSLRQEAKTLPPGIEKEMLLKKARQNDAAAQMTEWLRSPLG
ncbi:hypothetical protein RX327_09215 [Bradyrhizobium sp. BEA-2-5]|uniref:hypothetical protein n=1 Tax=Bradyrhizobium sp. BEA-2-5 TaxID=3080015 RepID=UPI00293F6770|nr:hypothetical protein [Bradyrhizobium sp. BEA-2-5]WOH83292.1 hypothetical protein RX327_09215 [Bradyrhizobium sp. BEA-2-5]